MWTAKTEIISGWLLGDFAYAVLPIVFVLILTGVDSNFRTSISSMPEWSFATVIFYGVSLRHHIQHNVRYKRANQTKLDVGAQFYTLLLILSGVTLALAMKTEHDKSSPLFVVLLQLLLFSGGVLSLLFDSTRETLKRRQLESDTEELPLGEALDHARSQVAMAVKGARMATMVIDKRLPRGEVLDIFDLETLDRIRAAIHELPRLADTLQTEFDRRLPDSHGAAGGEIIVTASEQTLPVPEAVAGPVTLHP